MESVKKYHIGDHGLTEGEAPGWSTVYLAADYDAAVMRIGNMVCANRQMDEELEIARDDLAIFKSGLSALGEATKKLVVCARTSGGTAGPDQGLMDACAGVESVITLPGVARAMNEFERIQAENLALQQRLTVQDQRIDELEGLLTLWYGENANGRVHVDDDAYHVVTATAVAIDFKPTAEAESHA